MKLPFSHNRRFRRTGTALAAGLLATQPLPAATPGHVVLVHGLWDTFHTLRKMEKCLREAGFDPIVVSLTPNGGQPRLDLLGEQVHHQIEARLPHGERFSMVGFSMGGLVARAYLRQFGDPSRVATFVTIAAPHHGTWMAWLTGGAGVKDMRPGSKFLAAVDADATRFSSTRWVTIRTPFDLIIVPSTSSMLPWAENHSFPVLVHPMLVFDDRVLECTVRALRAGPASRTSVREPQVSPHAESLRPRSPGIPRHR